MISKSAEDLIDSYTEEIRKKLPLRFVFCLLLGIALYWGASNGTYKSALLSTLSLNLNDAIAGNKSLLDLPNYIYTVVFASIYLLFRITQKLSERYISYIANLPRIREPVAKLFTEQAPIEIDSGQEIDSLAFEVLTRDFNIAREKIEKLASNSQTMLVSGIIIIGSSYYGNILDIAAGMTLLIAGIVGSHQSCKIFIQDLLPKRARIKRIFLILTKNTPISQP